jgi:hypothetical protein
MKTLNAKYLNNNFDKKVKEMIRVGLEISSIPTIANFLFTIFFETAKIAQIIPTKNKTSPTGPVNEHKTELPPHEQAIINESKRNALNKKRTVKKTSSNTFCRLFGLVSSFLLIKIIAATGRMINTVGRKKYK